MKRQYIFVTFFMLLSIQLNAQAKYWVFLKDKGGATDTKFVSDKTLSNRLMLNLKHDQYTDFPVKGEYIRNVNCYGKVLNKSKWLNALSVVANESEIKLIEKLPFVKEVRPMKTIGQLAGTAVGHDPEQNYSAINQINGNCLETENLTGKGVSIGVIDGRFSGADKNILLQHIIPGNILGVKDFITPGNTAFYKVSSKISDSHGTAVLLMLAGIDKLKNIKSGLATSASYYLASAENPDKEKKGEEDSWIAALEWMDSTGVRLVNSSVGYSDGFDNPADNYLPGQMDGKTSVVAQAVRIAIDEKGMIIVVAAGNNGNKNWRVVSTPADVADAISVGATDYDNLKDVNSSIGLSGNAFLKPDIVCLSPGGTSLSAPVITGMIACLLQKDPSLTNQRIKELIKRSGSLYPFGNNYIGYGIPDVRKVLQLLRDPDKDFKNYKRIKVNASYVFLKGKEYVSGNATIFHKSNERDVILQNLITPVKNGLMINKEDDALYSTVSFNNEKEVLEIQWQYP
jgi:subtilisin family serine protease